MRLFSISEEEETSFILIIGPAFLTLGITMLLFFNMPRLSYSSIQPYPVVLEPNTMRNTITMKHFSFIPEILKVNKGGAVVWTNEDAIRHSATANDGSFDTGILGHGKSGSITFDTPGTYIYHCSFHPYMRGTIIVL